MADFELTVTAAGSTENRQPVEDRHIAFARDVVAAARRHGVRHIKGEFYGDPRWTKVSMQWTMPGEGSVSRISLRAEASHHVEESADD